MHMKVYLISTTCIHTRVHVHVHVHSTIPIKPKLLAMTELSTRMKDFNYTDV